MNLVKSGRQSGFTLIELMVVVAIISILSTIAIVTMQSFAARAQVTAGLADIRGGATSFEERLTVSSEIVNIPSDIGVPASTAACATISVEHGDEVFIECELAGHPLIRGRTITLERNMDSGSWQCTTIGLATRFRPAECN